MQQVSRLKAVGTGLVRFSNSPISRVWRSKPACGGVPQAMVSLGDSNMQDQQTEPASGRRSRGGVPVAVAGTADVTNNSVMVLTKLSPSGHEGDSYNEDLLQRIVHHCPEVLPLWDIEPAFYRARSICCELPLGDDPGNPVGYVDNLLVTPDGGIVIVECKLIRNSEAKRAVVAQLLGYIAEMTRWSYEDLERGIMAARRWMKSAWEVDTETASLYSLAGGAAADLEEDRFVEAVSRNLRRGRMLGLIVGDGLSQSVRNIADMLARQSATQFSLGLVQLDIYRMPPGSAFPLMVLPRIEARTEIYPLTVRVVDGFVVDPAPAVTRKPEPAVKVGVTTLTREMFFEVLAEAAPDLIETVKAFVGDCEAAGCQIGGGAASIKILAQDRDGRTWNLGSLMKKGDVWVFGLNLKDAAYGTNIGTAYMQGVAALVAGAFVRPPSSPTLDAEIRMSKGYLRLADLMAVRDRWLDLIRKVVEEIGRVPVGD